VQVAEIISPRQIRVSKGETPPVDGNKVLVRLLRAAICGSDLPYFSNSYAPESYPLPQGYPGHECLGIVEESRNEGLVAGDHVMYYPVFLDGFKEYHVTDSSRLQKLPSDGNWDLLIMTQILGAVSHCVFRIDKPYNKSVVIMGQGTVGLLFTSLMKNSGAKYIIAVDPCDYRLAVAEKMGADSVINPERQDLGPAVSDLTKGVMADIVIDAYGQESHVINQCFELARHNGQVAFFGICLEEAPRLNFNTFFRKELRMISSVGPDLSLDYPYALDLILRDVVDVSQIVTHVIPFEEIQRGFEMASNRLDNAIKVILEF
jgi:L-iditol 2-dehydrogenase